MKTYHYKGLTEKGESASGFFDGDERAFKSFIRERRITLISFKEHTKKRKKGRFSATDLREIVEELYHLIASGMRIDDALKLIRKNAAKESSEQFLDSLLTDLRGGTPLSEALKIAAKKVDYAMPSIAYEVVASGEEIGNLAYSLNALTEYLLFQEKVRGEVKQAMTYPLFLITMSLGMISFVFFFIVPKFTEIFSPEEMNTLPSISKWVLKTGLFINENSALTLVILGSMVILGYFGGRYLKQNFFQVAALIPMLNEMVIRLELSKSFSSLGTLLSGGIEIDKALRQSARISASKEIRDLFSDAAKEIKKGRRLSDIVALSSAVPPSAVSLISVGENSARLGEVLLTLSERYSDEFRERMKRVLSLLEPIVIVLMGGVIATVVIAIMMAVMSVSNIAM